MARHKSVETKRLTELGRALNDWDDVLNGVLFFRNVTGVADSSDKAAMREIALMDDTYENRELLQSAAYRCGLPEHEADALAQWAKSDGVLKYGHSVMCEELADYVRGTWPGVYELADEVEEGDDEVLASWFVSPETETDTVLFYRDDYKLNVWTDTDAAERIALSCPDLEHPPIAIAMSACGGDTEHVVCATIDDLVKVIGERIARLEREGK